MTSGTPSVLVYSVVWPSGHTTVTVYSSRGSNLAVSSMLPETVTVSPGSRTLPSESTHPVNFCPSGASGASRTVCSDPSMTSTTSRSPPVTYVTVSVSGSR